MIPTNIRLDPYTTYSMIINEVENISKIIIKTDRIHKGDSNDYTDHFSKNDLAQYWREKNNEKMYLKIETGKILKSYQRYFY